MRTDNIEIDGLNLRVRTWPGEGAGPPLLIFNGIGGNFEQLQPFVQALDGVKTISFDAPGTGGSSTPGTPYRFSGLAKLTKRLLDELGYDVVDVLGISWGGGLAQQFAYQFPSRCRRLILAATSTGHLMVPGKPTALLRMMSPWRYFKPQNMIATAPYIYGGSFKDSPELAIEHAARIRRPSGLGYYWQVFAVCGWTSVFWLHRLSQRTLILAGDDDPLIPVVNARIMNRLIPNSSVRIVDCGHLFIVTRADEVARMVREFLTRL